MNKFTERTLGCLQLVVNVHYSGDLHQVEP